VPHGLVAFVFSILSSRQNGTLAKKKNSG